MYLPVPVINIGFIKVNVVHSAAMINIGINLPMETSCQHKTNRGAGDNYGDHNVVANREICLVDNDLEDLPVNVNNMTKIGTGNGD